MKRRWLTVCVLALCVCAGCTQTNMEISKQSDPEDLPDKREAALTFDDAPNTDFTPQVLDALKKKE